MDDCDNNLCLLGPYYLQKLQVIANISFLFLAFVVLF